MFKIKSKEMTRCFADTLIMLITPLPSGEGTPSGSTNPNLEEKLSLCRSLRNDASEDSCRRVLTQITDSILPPITRDDVEGLFKDPETYIHSITARTALQNDERFKKMVSGVFHAMGATYLAQGHQYSTPDSQEKCYKDAMACYARALSYCGKGDYYHPMKFEIARLYQYGCRSDGYGMNVDNALKIYKEIGKDSSHLFYQRAELEKKFFDDLTSLYNKMSGKLADASQIKSDIDIAARTFFNDENPSDADVSSFTAVLEQKNKQLDNLLRDSPLKRSCKALMGGLITIVATVLTLGAVWMNKKAKDELRGTFFSHEHKPIIDATSEFTREQVEMANNRHLNPKS